MVTDKTTINGVEYKTEKKNSNDVKFYINGEEVFFYAVKVVTVIKEKKKRKVISITIIE